ncbi:hypothetical protein BDZ89DRAFT_769500 [Hymenopellis radicata]|nr:hypothetical protein BDZ89DRAFT_769500 [Hymenopellis radicata]
MMNSRRRRPLPCLNVGLAGCFIEGRRVPRPCSTLPRLGTCLTAVKHWTFNEDDDDVNVERLPLRQGWLIRLRLDVTHWPILQSNGCASHVTATCR